MAGMKGFEPLHGGFRVHSLTAWLHPNLACSYILRFFIKMSIRNFKNSAAPGRKNRTSLFRVLSAVMNETNCAPETDKGSLKLPFFFIRGH